MNTAIASEISPNQIERQPSPAAVPEVPEPAPIETQAAAIPPPATIADSGITQPPSGVFSPGPLAASTFSPFTPQSEQPPVLRPDSRTAASTDQLRGDTLSIRSATTTGSQGGSRHPDFTETGLNSSIIETVSARFENGQLTSSSLIGEIALAYNPADFSSPFGSETIRLDNFGSLEKVAPNPAFIKQVPDREGEYSLNLAGVAKTQVAFKYQFRTEEASSHAPLLITPAFKIEPNQCSVIVSYSLNPPFDLHGSGNVKLSNVMLALTLEGTKASSCLSKPTGVFAREKNLIYWQLNDVVLTPGAKPEKLLARFATDSEASGGSVEARWEIVSADGTEGLGSGVSLSVRPSSSGGGVGGGGDDTDPFADESSLTSSGWKPVLGARRVISGGYFAK